MSLLNADYEQFLSEHAVIASLITESRPAIVKIWGTGVRIIPELIDDDGEQRVWVHIHTDNSDWSLLDRFDKEWWLSHCGIGEGLLNFDLSVTER